MGSWVLCDVRASVGREMRFVAHLRPIEIADAFVTDFRCPPSRVFRDADVRFRKSFLSVLVVISPCVFFVFQEPRRPKEEHAMVATTTATGTTTVVAAAAPVENDKSDFENKTPHKKFVSPKCASRRIVGRVDEKNARRSTFPDESL